MSKSFQAIVEKLTGQPIPFPENLSKVEKLDNTNLNLGYSQLNEILLYLGYDRVNLSFFQFLTDETLNYKNTSTISNIDQLAKHVDKVVEYSLILFGNIKYGYKQFSSESNEEEFQKWYHSLQPVDKSIYVDRHEPLFKLENIQNDDTYYLGYIIQAEITKRLAESPDDHHYLAMKTQMDRILQSGINNNEAYLASDHMDVCVATSMRQRHEYLFISRVTQEIFAQPFLQELNIRYFDPTQAYCSDRIDKGISEALMLKRAKCTIYLAQESDTLGKDSELASTLAQGKTVIAYIPKGDKNFVDNLLKDLSVINPGKRHKDIILDQLKVFNPDLCWTSKELRNWIDSDDENEDYGMELLYQTVERKYDTRATTLKDTHPLGIQVNLETGVANGVMVTRTIEECATLVRQVLLKELRFELVEEKKGDINYIILKEAITGSIYRVATGDKLLTNIFWNYYLP